MTALRRRMLRFGEHAYPFLWGHDCLAAFAEELRALDSDLYIVVTDRRVERLLGRPLINALSLRAQVETLLVEPAGEAGKTLEVLGRLADRALAAGATRRSVVVTLGGGVPGNVGGLLASLLFRGIRLVHVPTTLVGMFDSVVSLKQAVNTRWGKNLLGSYHRPEMVLADVRTLAYLPREQVRSGLCEVIKNALAIDPSVIERLEARLSPDCELDEETFMWLLETSLDAKARVMADDPHEKGAGIILEYGHTVGHAIELADYRRSDTGISHGEAVAIGMLVAAEVATSLGVLSPSARAAHYRLVDLIGARSRVPIGLEPDEVLDLVGYDNKRGHRCLGPDAVAMILLGDLGQPLRDESSLLTSVPRARLCEVLDGFFSASAVERRRATR